MGNTNGNKDIEVQAEYTVASERNMRVESANQDMWCLVVGSGGGRTRGCRRYTTGGQKGAGRRTRKMRDARGSRYEGKRHQRKRQVWKGCTRRDVVRGMYKMLGSDTRRGSLG